MSKTSEVTPEPGWIRQIRETDEGTKAQAETDLQHRLPVSVTIGANAPKFWRQLVTELKKATPHLAKVGALGSADLLQSDSPSCAPPSQEHCYISLLANGRFPRITNLNLYYTNGDCQITCYPLEGDPFTLDLVLDPKGNVAVSTTSGCWNPQETAEYVLRRMFERIGIEV